MLQLIKATAHEVDLEVPADVRVRAVHKAETLVRFSWLGTPSTFLLLKKPGHDDITAALLQIGQYLAGRAGPSAKLIVEPTVYRELAGNGLSLHTWSTSGPGANAAGRPPAEATVELTSLSEVMRAHKGTRRRRALHAPGGAPMHADEPRGARPPHDRR